MEIRDRKKKRSQKFGQPEITTEEIEPSRRVSEPVLVLGTNIKDCLKRAIESDLEHKHFRDKNLRKILKTRWMPGTFEKR